MVVVTKCYPDMQPLDFRIYSNGLELFPYQKLYFSTLEYGTIKPLFPHLNKEEFSLNELRKKHLFLVTGIASPQPLVEKLEQKTYNLYTKFYPDHHSFTEQDVESIRKWVDTVDDNNRIILTTEKDAIRFRELTYLPEEMQQMLYYIPIDISFVKEKQKDSFNKTIIKHVRKYQTNGRISEK